MKQTILFSDLQGDIFDVGSVEDCRFYPEMGEKLKEIIGVGSKLVYIPAPLWDGVEDRFFDTIISCFGALGIRFDEVVRVSPNQETSIGEVDEKTVFFLMGGSPISQMEIIRDYGMMDVLRNHKGLVIGFCAGAINLSEYSIITTDSDFPEKSSYVGIGRVGVSVEPCFHLDDSDFAKNRVDELRGFARQYDTKIYAMSDDAFMYCAGDDVELNGGIEIYEAV